MKQVTEPIDLPLGLSIAPLQIRLLEVLSRTAGEHIELSFYWEVLDRDPPHAPLVLEFAELIPRMTLDRPEYYYATVRRIMTHIVTHEIDELIRCDGARVREVHK